jgi:hypothetical protein
MIRVIDAIAVSPPLTAWTVIGKLPVVVEFVVVNVRVELKGGFCDWGLKTAATPEGTLSRLNWAGCGYPLVRLMLREKVAVCPGLMVCVEGDADI